MREMKDLEHDSESTIVSCLSRLDNLIQSVGRLQRAHAQRAINPASERSFHEIRLAKAAIETDYQTLKMKLTQVRDSLAGDEQRTKSARRRTLTDKVFPR
jgi:hypothetical protein